MSSVSPFTPITRDDAARIMKKSVRTLENWCDDTTMPRPASIGGSRYWHPDVFYGWLDAKLRGETWNGEPALGAAAKTVTPFQPLTREDAVEIMGKSVRTLENWYDVGVMPSPVAIGPGRALYWHPEIFYEWLDVSLKGRVWSPDAPNPSQASSESPAAGVVAAAPSVSATAKGASQRLSKREGATASARSRAKDSALLKAINDVGSKRDAR